MTFYDWLDGFPQWYIVLFLVFVMLLIAWIITRFSSISIRGVAVGKEKRSVLAKIIQREMDLHEEGYKLAREHAIDIEVRMVRDQMNAAEQLIEEAMSVLRLAYLEHLRGMGYKGSQVGQPLYRDWLRLERDMTHELRNELRFAMRENGLSMMDGDTYSTYRKRRIDGLFVRITMTKDELWASEVVRSDDLHNLLVISKDAVAGIFGRCFDEARAIAIRYRDRHAIELNDYGVKRQDFYEWLQEELTACA